MMKRNEYWICKISVVSWRRCALLVAAALCAVLLASCGAHDRALVFSLQEDASESLQLQNGVAEQGDGSVIENAVESDAGSMSGIAWGAGSGSESETVVSQANTSGMLGAEKMNAEQSTLLYIHVCGAVASPGVVEVPQGSRVEDALLAAGGFREDAATDYVNLAARVEDGQQLYFPTKEEAESLIRDEGSLQQEGLTAQKSQSGKVNLNTASAELLCTLPGIGEARARDIIAYRETQGAFASVEEIMQVSGIKESVFEKLQDKITVN